MRNRRGQEVEKKEVYVINARTDIPTFAMAMAFCISALYLLAF